MFAYYWYHFMPLARGTAAVGYITILGLFLSADMPVNANIPKDSQVDWEAILSRTPEAFIASVSKWLYPAAVVGSGEKVHPHPSVLRSFHVTCLPFSHLVESPPLSSHFSYHWMVLSCD